MNLCGVPDQFPAGLRVIVVDDDSTCLMILEKMLRHCNYEVTTCNKAEVALSLLRENKSGFDVVISEVHMPDMDGFKLLEHIQLEMDLPVIMMSADSSKSAVMKGVTHGACDYLIKPVCIEALRNIWQHVVRKRKHEWKDSDPSTNADKPRVVWSIELHQQFVAAVNQLGINKAVPKKILELMNAPGLTRANVASHLQKYRLYLRRLRASLHAGGMNTGYMGGPDAGYGSMEPQQFVSLNQSGQHSLGSMNDLVLIQMGGRGQSQRQSQSQAQLTTNAHHGLRQPVVSNEMLTCGDDGIIDAKVPRKEIVPKNEIFSDLKQNRNWDLQDVRLTFDQSQKTSQTGTDASNPLLLQHNRSSGCDLEGQNHDMGARAGAPGVATVTTTVVVVVVIVILIIVIRFPKLLLIATP